MAGNQENSTQKKMAAFALPLILALVVLPLYQNCGKTQFSSQLGNSETSQELASEALDKNDCAQGVFIWEEGDSSCSAEAPFTKSGVSVNVVDTQLQFLGSAVFICEQGVRTLDLNKPHSCSQQTSIDTQKIDGKCGSSNNQTLLSRPSFNLCQNGMAGAVQGSGPWSWSCFGVQGGKTDSCLALKSNAPTADPPTANPPTTKQVRTEVTCSDSTILSGTKVCYQPADGGIPNCGSCLPKMCAEGYELGYTNGSVGANACISLNQGSCTIPSGTIKLMPQSTVSAWTCEVNQSGQTLSVGQSTTFSCKNNGFSARLPVRCQTENTSNPQNNGGKPYYQKRLFYDRGIYDNDWFYMAVSKSRNPIFEDYLGEKNVSFNYPCRTSPDISYSGYGGVRILGPFTATAPKSVQSRCIESEEEGWKIVTVKCSGHPSQYDPLFGNWEFISGVSATRSADGNTCNGKGGTSAQTKVWTSH